MYIADGLRTSITMTGLPTLSTPRPTEPQGRTAISPSLLQTLEKLGIPDITVLLKREK